MTSPVLLTPGPLTTSAETKAAMLCDWGSWDGAFNELTASVCRDLVAIVNGQRDHVCIPLQGSGTFAVEAAIGTFIPRSSKVLVPDNGAYCKRIARILDYTSRQDEAALVKAGKYTGKAREEIARRLGKLLSYPDSGIQTLLDKEQQRE